LPHSGHATLKEHRDEFDRMADSFSKNHLIHSGVLQVIINDEEKFIAGPRFDMFTAVCLAYQTG
jgi:hypothetical protein